MQCGDITDQEGRMLVQAARKIVTDHLSGRQAAPDDDFKSRFSFHAGVFVTLCKSGSLCGCIGVPYPARKLHDALADAAISAAVADPRFQSVSLSDLDEITFEVTVLSEPQEIAASSPRQYLSEIATGRDGLIVQSQHNSGLLLPQVAAEYGWTAEEFLRNTCQKAGLDEDCWKRADTKISKFQGVIFKEERPCGQVVRQA